MRRDVHHYFQQALRRRSQANVFAAAFIADEDAQAAFNFRIGSAQRIAQIDYRCTTCVTLVALCEHLAEHLEGETVQQARTLTAETLLALHPEIPACRTSRAQLALAAVRAGLENASS